MGGSAAGNRETCKVWKETGRWERLQAGRAWPGAPTGPQTGIDACAWEEEVPGGAGAPPEGGRLS